MVEWDKRFGPSYTPLEMLELGVFEGKYINNIKEVPASWKQLPTVVGPKDPPNVELNHYKVKSRQPLSEWKAKGWIDDVDPEGWFAWYIKYFLGRRLPEIDDKQIKRWRSFVARHEGQIAANCKLSDQTCRPVQRQGLLQWGWDSSIRYDERVVVANAQRLAKAAKARVGVESIISVPAGLHKW